MSSNPTQPKAPLNERQLLEVSQDFQRIHGRVQDVLSSLRCGAAETATKDGSETVNSAGESISVAHKANKVERAGRAMRPRLYPHEPLPREDALERNKFHQTDLLEALQLESFQGFYNLAALLLVFNVGYLTVRNLLEKGWRVSLEPLYCREVILDFSLAGLLIFACIVLSYAVFGMTRLFAYGRIRSRTYFGLYGAIQFFAIVAPIIIMYNTSIAPLPTAGTILLMAVLALKSHSYVATNFALKAETQHLEDSDENKTSNQKEKGASSRSGTPSEHENSPKSTARKRRSGQTKKTPADDVPEPSSEQVAEEPIDNTTRVCSFNERTVRNFPRNVTLGDFTYFLLAPTLVYEPYYPRSSHIRWFYVLTKIIEIIACCFIQYFLAHQFMLPVLKAREHPFWYDCLKLAMPTFMVWIIGFYCGFHSYLNLVAELTRFADREFYQDWWNSTSIEKFWKKWNVPVHEWCLRHIYVESMHYANATKGMATLGTFLFSAFFHELISSVAFKTFRPWFFLGMTVQIPLMLIGRYFVGRRRGNFLVWLSLFTMQPFIELLYFREWFAEREELFCIPRKGLFV